MVLYVTRSDDLRQRISVFFKYLNTIILYFYDPSIAVDHICLGNDLVLFTFPTPLTFF